MKNVFLVLFIFLGLLFYPRLTYGQEETVHSRYILCALGDSQVERGAYLISALRRELGPDYEVRGYGRRGWTTSRWIRAGDFSRVCAGADIILVSLGGNDRHNGRSWTFIKNNVDLLLGTLPSGVLVYHMPIPRYYRPSVGLADDGIHLSLRGARVYAEIIAPHLRINHRVAP